MTAEIAVMNREAVALAADSAVTFRQDGGPKVFTSANKLFALSKYRPVAIMVYGQASFLGVPWETIVKTYRHQLGMRSFDTLGEYADGFISFLVHKNPLFPKDQQDDQFHVDTAAYFGLIRDRIREAVSAEIPKDEEGIEDDETAKITEEVIRDHFDRLDSAAQLPSIPKTHARKILKAHGDLIDQAIDETFEELPIPEKCRKQLRAISIGLFVKDLFFGSSGVVIAGFGQQEPFPALRSFEIGGILDNKLKYAERHSSGVDYDTGASIVPFAQREMVDLFMQGIHPELGKYMMRDLADICEEYPAVIVDHVSGVTGNISDGTKTQLLADLKEATDTLFEAYQTNVSFFAKNRYVDPVLDVVAMLPKDELAAMAEALVNLTLFKLKVTSETETVAGPIDVAVVSKGDGFVWIKRKHYFRAELNPQFLANYYRENDDGEN